MKPKRFFKKGDKVMFVGPHNSTTRLYDLVVMQVYTVAKCSELNSIIPHYLISVAPGGWYFNAELFTLIQEEEKKL